MIRRDFLKWLGLGAVAAPAIAKELVAAAPIDDGMIVCEVADAEVYTFAESTAVPRVIYSVSDLLPPEIEQLMGTGRVPGVADCQGWLPPEQAFDGSSDGHSWPVLNSQGDEIGQIVGLMPTAEEEGW